MEFDRKVEFYQHDQHWANRMILGNSLQVMTSLAEKEGLKGKVQMIYIDPPYGIKFGSNWQVSTRKRDVKDGKTRGHDEAARADSSFRDTWQFGIHSYLAYLRDRLMLAANSDVSRELSSCRLVMKTFILYDAFSTKFLAAKISCSLITFQNTVGAAVEFLPEKPDYHYLVRKEPRTIKYQPALSEREWGEAGASKYNKTELPDGTRRLLNSENRGRGRFRERLIGRR